MESRALFLQPTVCRTIAKRCIPVAVNALLSSPYAVDRTYWDCMQKQGLRGANVMFLSTADGTYLGRFENNDLDTPLAAWDKLPASRRKPGAMTVEARGKKDPDTWDPQLPEGGLVVKTFMRALDRDDKDRLSAPKTLSLGVSKTVIAAEPNRDSLWLTAEEWKSLVPEKPKVGQKQVVPAGVRDRIYRFHLVDGACCLPGWWPRNTPLSGDLTLTVEEVTPSTIRMVVHGKPRIGAAKDEVAFTLGGLLVFDRTKKAFDKFLLAAVSDRPCHKDTATGKMLTLGVAFDLGGPTDRRPPYRLWEKNSTKDYFGE
jgi:hypothetical protein